MTTKREVFLDTMNNIIPWDEWINIIVSFYPSVKRGRPTIGIETMLRMYLLQVWFNLSDEGVEDAIYDSHAMRNFMKLNFMEESVPDATTLLKFRHLLEDNDICKKLFDDINNRLEDTGLIMHGGTIVDATIINAPSSTKNASGKRDSEMHQTKKGNQWYYGMKVDAGSGFVHTITGTSANFHDSAEAHKLIRDDDTVVYGDSGYLGLLNKEEVLNSSHLSSIDYRINKRPSQLKTPDNYFGINWDKEIESNTKNHLYAAKRSIRY